MPRSPLPPGARAPDFRLPTTPGGSLALAELRGKPLVLVFYPADFSPVCGDELAVFNELLPDLHRLGARVVGISVDGVYCHAAFAREKGLRFPLLADFHPKGEVSRAYHAYREGDGMSERALYVLDRSGTIVFSHLSPIEVNPGAAGVLEALERLAEAEVEARP